MKLLKQFIKTVTSRFVYRVSAYHPIYIRKSMNPKIYEFIGLGGKTYVLKKIKKKLRKIRLRFDENLYKSSLNQTPSLSNLIFEIIEESKYHPGFHYFIFSALEKSLLQEQFIKNYDQFWDEGIIKQCLHFVIKIKRRNPEYLAELLNSHFFIFILPPQETILNRYSLREGIVSVESKKKLGDYIHNKTNILNEFLEFLKIYNIPHYVLNDSTSDEINRLSNELNL